MPIGLLADTLFNASEVPTCDQFVVKLDPSNGDLPIHEALPLPSTLPWMQDGFQVTFILEADVPNGTSVNLDDTAATAHPTMNNFSDTNYVYLNEMGESISVYCDKLTTNGVFNFNQ